MLSPDSPAASAGPIHAAIAGIEARLQAAFPTNRFQHEVLAAPLMNKVIGAIASHRTPFVGLAFLGLKRGPNTARIYDAKLRFGVYLLVSHPASRGRLVGDRQGPGLAQMVHAAVCALHGWTLAGSRDAGVGSMEVGDLDNADGSEWSKDHTACAVLSLDVPATFTTADPDILETIAATWTFDGDVEVATDTFVRPA